MCPDPTQELPIKLPALLPSCTLPVACLDLNTPLIPSETAHQRLELAALGKNHLLCPPHWTRLHSDVRPGQGPLNP